MQEQDYGRLRFKITATTLAFSLLPLFILGWVIHLQFNTAYTDKVMSSMAATVANKRRTIDFFLEERMAQLRTLGQTHSARELTAPGALEQMFRVIQAQSRSYVDLGVIDSQGRHAAYVGPYRLQDVNYSAEGWFAETMMRGQYLSDVFLGFRNFPHIIIAVRCGQGSESWILRATIDSEVFNSLVQSLRTGRSGDAFLVNETGQLQTPSRFGGDVLATLPLDPGGVFHGERVEELVLGENRRIVGQAWLTRTHWLLMVTEDPDEAMSPLFRTRWIGALALATVAGVIILGTVLVTRSTVAKIRRADQERAALDAELMQAGKMAALGKLAAGVAHEINNPLTLIMENAGWIQDLLTEEDPSAIEGFAEIDGAVRKIEQHVERARQVTHRMLGFARRMEPVEEDVDLNHLAEQAISFLQSEATLRDIALERAYDQDLPRISTDTAQVQQVLLNLLDNAIDAVDRNGEVTVSTGATADGQGVWLTVTDDGPGIPEPVLARIFEPFFTTKSPGQGTGLGLSIAYSIIRKLGGELQAANVPGAGASFTITLPRQATGAGKGARDNEES